MAMAGLAGILMFPALAWALQGDVNSSGRVDGLDLAIVSRLQGSVRGDAAFQEAADLDGDGRVDRSDLAILRANFARTGRDQAAWLADTDNDRLAKLSPASGRTLLTVPGIRRPTQVAVDSLRGDAWTIASTGTVVIHVSPGGQRLATLTGFGEAVDLAVNPETGRCWIVDSTPGKVHIVDRNTPDGYDVTTGSGSHQTISDLSSSVRGGAITLDGRRGLAWIGDTNGLTRILTSVPANYSLSTGTGSHLRNTLFDSQVVSTNRVDGTVFAGSNRSDPFLRVDAGNTASVLEIKGLGNVVSLAANEVDGSVWLGVESTLSSVTTTRLLHLSGDGGELFRRVVESATDLSVDPLTGDLWLANPNRNAIERYSASGVRSLDLPRFNRPTSIDVTPGDLPAGAPIVRAIISPSRAGVGEPVTFFANVIGGENRIERIEWDFDGNGSFDFSSGDTFTTTRAFQTSGIFKPILKAIDREGLAGTDYSGLVRVGRLVAQLNVDKPSNPVRSNFKFTTSVSNPQGVKLANFQYDFDGDGVFDAFNVADGDTDEISFAFSSPGAFQATVKVTDENGKTITAVREVRADAVPPGASLRTRSSGDFAPVRITATASVSPSNLPGITYQWDQDGNGTIDLDTLTRNETVFVYDTPGNFALQVHVTDASGATAIATRIIDVSAPSSEINIPPRVFLEASPSSGTAPLTVDFTGSTADPDGTITRFAYRFDSAEATRTLLLDGAETSTGGFTSEAPWARSTDSAFTGSRAWTDSPGGNYSPDSDVSLTSPSIPAAGITSFTLQFNHKYQFFSPDLGAVEVSADGGTFLQVARFPPLDNISFQSNFIAATVKFGVPQGTSNFRFRFRVVTDSSSEHDGWTLDDIRLNKDVAPDFSSTSSLATQHTYTSAGTFIPELIVTDDDGAETRFTRIVTVRADGAPTAVANATPATGSPPVTIQLSATGSSALSGSLTRYRWYFDKGFFLDDMESGTSKWTAQSPWAITTEAANSGTFSWTDSPGGNYEGGVDVSLVSDPFDIPPRPARSYLSFWQRYDTESCCDEATVEISTDGGITFGPLRQSSGALAQFKGTQLDFAPEELPLDAFAGLSGVRIRFRLTPDSNINRDGWYIDDVRIATRSPTDVAPDFDSATTGSTSVSYTVPAIYRPVLRVTSSGGDGDDSVAVTAGGFDAGSGTGRGSAPTVTLSSLRSSVAVLPAEVKFTANTTPGSDPIDRYEWDFDANGLVDAVTRTSNKITAFYTEPGLTTATVQVFDILGRSSPLASRSFTLSPRSPAVQIRATPVSGRIPMNVTLTPSISSDAPVTSFTWFFETLSRPDFSGSGVPVTTQYTYDTSGNFGARLTVIDAFGKSGTNSVSIQARSSTVVNVALASSITIGIPPVEATFTPTPLPSTSNGQPIVRYDYDFDGNGVVDRSVTTSEPQKHLFTRGGDFESRVTVFEPGGQSGSATVRIRIGQPPTALPRAFPLSGPAPLLVRFEALGSDPDGSIQIYDFDFLGRGFFGQNETSTFNTIRHLTRTRVAKPVEYIYSVPGTYDALMRVTDDDGFTDSKTIRIVVGPPDLATLLASPRSGPVPLRSRLTAGLDGGLRASRYDFDLDGNGTFEVTTSSNHVDLTLSSAGLVRPRVRITSTSGESVTTSTEVRALAVDAPSVEIQVDPGAGSAALPVELSAQIKSRFAPQQFQWDFEGNGSFDSTSTTTADQIHVYSEPGLFMPTLRVTDISGKVGEDRKAIQVGLGIASERSSDQFDPAEGERIGIRSILSASARVTLRIVNQDRQTVRTLVNAVTRPAGRYEDFWDGKGDGGSILPGGVYLYVFDLVSGGLTASHDLSGDAIAEPRRETPNYELVFDPLRNKFLTARYTLPRAGEVTVYIVTFDGSAREVVRTVLLREPQSSGSYVVSWDGILDGGDIAAGVRENGSAAGYLMPVFISDLPPNALILAGRPLITDLSVTPQIFSPLNPYQASDVQAVTVIYRISKAATVSATIRNEAGDVIRTLSTGQQSRGENQLLWDGKNNSGELSHRGAYRLELQAVDSGGLRSPRQTAVVRVLY